MNNDDVTHRGPSATAIARQELMDEGVLSAGPNADPRSLLDQNNPRAVVSLAPRVVKEAIARTPADFFDLTENELRAKGFVTKPSAIDCRLRTAFWIEYDRCQETMTQMVLKNIYTGACSQSYFVQAWLRNKYRVAWLLRPPSDYKLALEELLQYGLEEMREIMEIPVVDNAGRVNAKLADIKFKIWQAVEMRLKGAIIQKIRSENLNVNFNSDGAGPGAAPSSAAEDDVQALDRRIAELEGNLQQALPPAIKDLNALSPEQLKEVVELKD